MHVKSGHVDSGKIRTMESAISEFVSDGDSLFLSGMQHGEPSAAVHEILRQRITNLTLIPQIPESAQLLIAEGRVSRLLTGYTSILDVRRGVVARRSAQHPLDLVEFSHGALATSLLAAQLGVPFLPTKALLGSDYLAINEEYFKPMVSPFGGEPLIAVKAVAPDVAIMHVQRADKFGNAQKVGSLGMDVAGAHAARRLIITAESIVEREEIHATAGATTIPGFIVDAVVEAPWGAWPQHVSGCYRDDLAVWMSMFPNDDDFDTFLRDAVYGVHDRAGLVDYLQARLGADHFDNLRSGASDPNANLTARIPPR